MSAGLPPRTLHDETRATLAGWAAPDGAQAALREEFLAFLDAHPDGTTRACVDGHITGSVLVLSADRDEVLLTLHPKQGMWLQMGGHCEPEDRSIREAAAREGLEESGIDGLVLTGSPLRLDRHRVGCHGGSWHLDLQYAAIAPPGAEPRISEESLDLRWWPVASLPEPTDDALRRLVAAALDAPARHG